jgi:hypothetical protein
MSEEKFTKMTPVVIGGNTYKEQVKHQLAVLRTELGYIRLALDDHGHPLHPGVLAKLQHYVHKSKEMLFHAYNMVDEFDEPPDDGRYIRHPPVAKEEDVGVQDDTDPLQKPWLRNMVEETLSRADLGPKALLALGVLEMRKQQQDDEHDRLRQQYQETNNQYIDRERALKVLLDRWLDYFRSESFPSTLDDFELIGDTEEALGRK